MTKRSTRNKIRYQGQKMCDHVERQIACLRYLYELADGQSEYIENMTPQMVVLLDMVKESLERFRDGL